MRRILAVLVCIAAVAGLSCSKKPGPAPTAPANDPACALSASALSFGSVGVGSSADRSVTISNSGGGTLSGTVTETSPDFAIMGSASYSLGAGASALFSVRFAPSSAGAKACTLSTGSALCAAVVASGTGESVAPICFVQSTLIDFGTRDYGVTAQAVTYIQNAGGGTLSGSLAVLGANTDFTFLGPPTFNLGPREWANIGLQFRPSRGGTQRCTLQVQPAGCAPIVLHGEGMLPTHDHCAVGPTSGVVEFGEVSVGFTSERSFTLKNFSQTYIARGSVVDQCPEFEIGGTYNLFPLGTFQGVARFTPTQPGAQECAVPIGCWMDGEGTNPGVQSYLFCRGTGVGGSPQCQLSTTSLSFGQVAVDESRDLSFQITNTGTGSLTGIAGPSHCGPFTFVGPTKYSLGSGQSMTLTLRFTPTQAGHTITCSEIPMGSGCAALTAVGEGVEPPSCVVSPTDLDFGSVPVGQVRDLTFDLENGGGGALCGSVTESCPDFSIEVNPAYCITRPAFKRVTIRFIPTSAGFKQCTISPGTGCPAVTVRGTGT